MKIADNMQQSGVGGEKFLSTTKKILIREKDPDPGFTLTPFVFSGKPHRLHKVLLSETLA